RRRHAARPDRPDGHALDAAPAARDDGLEEREDRQQLVARALELIRADFHPHVWRAFWEFFAAGRDAAAVAAALRVRGEGGYSARRWKACSIDRRGLSPFPGNSRTA